MLRKFSKNLKLKGIMEFRIYDNDSEPKYDSDDEEVRYFAKKDDISLIRQTSYRLDDNDYLYRVVLRSGDSFLTDSESICLAFNLGTKD